MYQNCWHMYDVMIGVNGGWVCGFGIAQRGETIDPGIDGNNTHPTTINLLIIIHWEKAVLWC